MKHMCRNLILTGLVSCLQAEPVTVSFEAKVFEILNPQVIPYSLLKPGAIISGKYVFDPARKNSCTWPGWGIYEFSGPDFGFFVNMDNHLITPYQGAKFTIEVRDNLGGIDSLIFIGNETQTDDPLISDATVYWQLDDRDEKALKSGEMPQGLPPLERFAKDQQVLGVYYGGMYVNARVTRIALGDSLFHPKLRIMPESGSFLESQVINPVLRIDEKGSNASKIEQVLLNDVDVTREFASKATRGTLIGKPGGVIWDLGELRTKSGPQEFKVKVRFAQGTVGWAVANWNMSPVRMGEGNGRIEEKNKTRAGNSRGNLR